MIKRPQCGPRPGGNMWRKMISRDIRIANLARARKVKAEKEKDADSK